MLAGYIIYFMGTRVRSRVLIYSVGTRGYLRRERGGFVIDEAKAAVLWVYGRSGGGGGRWGGGYSFGCLHSFDHFETENCFYSK